MIKYFTFFTTLFVATVAEPGITRLPQWFYEPQQTIGNLRSSSNTVCNYQDPEFNKDQNLGSVPTFRKLNENPDSISDTQRDEIEAILLTYETAIDESHFNIQLGFGTSTDSDYNDFYRTCSDPLDYGNPVDFTFTSDSQFNGVETNRNQMLFRYSPEGTYDRTEIEDLNIHQSMFESNLDDYTSMSWQYYGAVDGTTATYPALNMTELGSCSTDGSVLPADERYDPTSRPWFISGASGQGDGIIVFDISDTSPGSDTRLEMQIDIALGIIDSRSYRDFWTVIVYSSYPRKFRSTLTRMDSIGKQMLTDYINGITLDLNGKTNIGLAIDEALNVFEESDTNGDTSLCHKSIILLTNGENDINVIDPLDLIKDSNLEVRIFSYILSPEDSNPARIFPTELACYTEGLVEIYYDYPFNLTSVILQDKPVALYNSYMAAGVNTEIGLWSDIYEDSLGQGKMMTITRSIYKALDDGTQELMGIIGFDVLISELTLNGTVTEVGLTALITENQVCEDFYLSYDSRTTLQGDDTCDNLYGNESVGEPGWMVLMWLIVVASVIVSCCVLICGFGCSVKLDDNFANTFFTVNFGCILAILILFWVGIWTDIVEAYEWRPVALTVEDGQLNPFDCCDVINCGCTESYGLESCSSMVSNIEEGYCNNGYHCCKKVYYECNCYTRTTCSKNRCSSYQSCSTCSTCTSSVNNRQCESVCGTCYYPSVYVNYEIDANGDGETSLLYSAFTGKCGRDQESCANGYINSYPEVGETFPGYYSIYNTAELKLDVGYNYTTIILFAIFIITDLYIWHKVIIIEFDINSSETNIGDMKNVKKRSVAITFASSKPQMSNPKRSRPMGVNNKQTVFGQQPSYMIEGPALEMRVHPVGRTRIPTFDSSSDN